MEAKQKYFKTDQIDQIEYVAILADVMVFSDTHKHEQKECLEEHLNKRYKVKGYKIDRWIWEKIRRKAEQYNLAFANMSFNEAKSIGIRQIKHVLGDADAKNRDKIMALQLLINMGGLDAKYSGGFEEDTTDELKDSLAAMDEDEKHNALSTLNSDEPVSD